MVDITRQANKCEYGRMWLRFAKLCQWDKCGVVVNDCIGHRYLQLISWNTSIEDSVVEGPHMLITHGHNIIDDMFMWSIWMLFVNGQELKELLDMSPMYSQLAVSRCPALKGLLSDSIEELDLKLTLRGV